MQIWLAARRVPSYPVTPGDTELSNVRTARRVMAKQEKDDDEGPGQARFSCGSWLPWRRPKKSSTIKRPSMSPNAIQGTYVLAFPRSYARSACLHTDCVLCCGFERRLLSPRPCARLSLVSVLFFPPPLALGRTSREPLCAMTPRAVLAERCGLHLVAGLANALQIERVRLSKVRCLPCRGDSMMKVMAMTDVGRRHAAGAHRERNRAANRERRVGTA